MGNNHWAGSTSRWDVAASVCHLETHHIRNIQKIARRLSHSEYQYQIWRFPKSSGYLQIIISHVAEDPLTRLQVKAIVPQATDLPETRIVSCGAQNIRWKIRWSTEIYCQEKKWYEFAHPTCIMNKTLLFLWVFNSFTGYASWVPFKKNCLMLSNNPTEMGLEQIEIDEIGNSWVSKQLILYLIPCWSYSWSYILGIITYLREWASILLGHVVDLHRRRGPNACR